MSLILLLAGVAHADDNPYLDALGRAREALVAADWAAATVALNEAEALAPASPVVLLPPDLARLDFYRGVIQWRAGDRNKQALDDWRRSLTLFPKAQPEAAVLPDVEGQDAYYALASEVITRPAVPLGLPDQTGEARIFVDGVRPESGDETLEGRHFVQVKCDDSSLIGSWYSFGPPPPDWFIVCNGGAYPSARGRRSSPTPDSSGDPVASTTTVDAPRKKEAAAVWTLVGTGGALVAGGAAVNFLVVNPTWREGQAANADPTSVTRKQAKAIVNRYDQARLATLILTGTGVVALGTGISIGLLDATITPTLGGITLQGAW